MKGRYARTLVIAFRVSGLAAAALVSRPESAGAQQTLGEARSTAILPGGELDEYLRYLQTTGNVTTGSWNLREHSLKRSAALFPTRAHPWEARLKSSLIVQPLVEMRAYPAEAVLRGNSAFPEGGNDGSVWAGRGLTVSASAGGMVRAGPVVLQLNPIAFIAQNAEFDLQLNGQTGIGAFRAGQPDYATSVDLPQRFGSGAYSRVDIGESELRVELPWFMAGVSNAHRIWGPASDYPFLLGTNAPGFAHAFISTNDALDLYLVKVNANILWGALEQSEYSPVTGSTTYYGLRESGTRRFATGVLVSMTPRGIPTLEFGVARFIAAPWPRSGLPRSYFTKVVQNFLKKSLRERTESNPTTIEATDNQLLSAFARWVLPKSGAEIYAEYGREDHAYDFRDLVSEPDHSRTYLLGARKVLTSADKYLSAVRAEIFNFQLPTTARHRDEGGIYLHGGLRQGHTQRGQLLGAPVGVGVGAASTLAYDRFTPGGRMTVSWTRKVNQEAGRFQAIGVESESAIDVTHSLGFERVMFRGPLDMTLGGNLSREFNRNFGADALNLGMVAGARYNLR